MGKKVIIFVFIGILLVSVFAWSKLFAFEKAPMMPDEVRAVFDKYAEQFPHGRLDHASRVGDRFFMGIIVFPRGDELDCRYVMVGLFREWEPIAEFTRLPY